MEKNTAKQPCKIMVLTVKKKGFINWNFNFLLRSILYWMMSGYWELFRSFWKRCCQKKQGLRCLLQTIIPNLFVFNYIFIYLWVIFVYSRALLIHCAFGWQTLHEIIRVNCLRSCWKHFGSDNIRYTLCFM